MLKQATWLHLRIPFSLFLLPVFLFALSISEDIDITKTLLAFVILHFFLYPASNGYNSFFDKDEESIGGLKNPPKVSVELYYTSLAFDFIAVILSLFIGWEFATLVIIYGLVSKGYSHPTVRLKRFAFTGWFIAGVFQGFFTFIMVYIGINEINFMHLLDDERAIFAALLSTLLLWGSYPMTQIYQHKEDARRGDRTLSLQLGIKGTFHFTAAVFSIANIGFIFFYTFYYQLWHALSFQLFLLPMLFYFLRWYFRARSDEAIVNYDATMTLNMISALSLNIFFFSFFLWEHYWSY